MAGTRTFGRWVCRSVARSAGGIALEASGPARLSGTRAKLVFTTALLLAITAGAVAVYAVSPGVVTAAWLAVGPLLASLVLSPRLTAVVAGWTLLLGLGPALGQPRPAHVFVSHLSVLVLLAAFAVANSALLRFYDPDHGRILLDGVDIRELSLQTLRYNITLLQQENLMFAGTIRDNIGYAARGATDADIHAAARAAGAHDVIAALPDGYRTQVGERGRLLSGGQRQRIALARAVLRDAPVLILDEPTTGLDPASARALMPLPGTAMAGRTIIVITHDQALAAAADTILHITGPAAPAPLAGPAGPATARRSADGGRRPPGQPAWRGDLLGSEAHRVEKAGAART